MKTMDNATSLARQACIKMLAVTPTQIFRSDMKVEDINQWIKDKRITKTVWGDI